MNSTWEWLGTLMLMGVMGLSGSALGVAQGPEELVATVEQEPSIGGANRPFLFVLEETHIGPVQRDVQRIIEALHQDLGLTVVGVEGTFAPCDKTDHQHCRLVQETAWPLDLSRIHQLASPETINDVAEGMFADLWLTGVEMAALRVPELHVYGIEDAEMMARNKERYRAYRQGSEELSKVFETALEAFLGRLTEEEGERFQEEMKQAGQRLEAANQDLTRVPLGALPFQTALELLREAGAAQGRWLEGWQQVQAKFRQTSVRARPIRELMEAAERIGDANADLLIDRAKAQGVNVQQLEAEMQRVRLARDQYYGAADERNRFMVENMLKALLGLDHHAAVMVIGAFHTPLVTQLLRARDVSYIVLTPPEAKRIEPTVRQVRRLDALIEELPTPWAERWWPKRGMKPSLLLSRPDERNAFALLCALVEGVKATFEGRPPPQIPAALGVQMEFKKTAQGGVEAVVRAGGRRDRWLFPEKPRPADVQNLARYYNEALSLQVSETAVWVYDGGAIIASQPLAEEFRFEVVLYPGTVAQIRREYDQQARIAVRPDGTPNPEFSRTVNEALSQRQQSGVLAPLRVLQPIVEHIAARLPAGQTARVPLLLPKELREIDVDAGCLLMALRGRTEFDRVTFFTVVPTEDSEEPGSLAEALKKLRRFPAQSQDIFVNALPFTKQEWTEQEPRPDSYPNFAKKQGINWDAYERSVLPVLKQVRKEVGDNNVIEANTAQDFLLQLMQRIAEARTACVGVTLVAHVQQGTQMVALKKESIPLEGLIAAIERLLVIIRQELGLDITLEWMTILCTGEVDPARPMLNRLEQVVLAIGPPGKALVPPVTGLTLYQWTLEEKRQGQPLSDAYASARKRLLRMWLENRLPAHVVPPFQPPLIQWIRVPTERQPVG